MNIYSLGLFVMVVVSVLVTALAVAYVKHLSRNEFIVLQGLQHERDRMDVEWGRLQLELSTLADPARIERVARERLQMRRPKPAEVHILWP